MFLRHCISSSRELCLLFIDMDSGTDCSIGDRLLRVHYPRQSADSWYCVHSKLLVTFSLAIVRSYQENSKAIALFGMLRYEVYSSIRCPLS